MGHLENPYCMRCGSTEGGQYGHETNECRLGREAEMDAIARAQHAAFFGK